MNEENGLLIYVMAKQWLQIKFMEELLVQKDWEIKRLYEAAQKELREISDQCENNPEHVSPNTGDPSITAPEGQAVVDVQDNQLCAA